jgi:hypothetical protein
MRTTMPKLLRKLIQALLAFSLISLILGEVARADDELPFSPKQAIELQRLDELRGTFMTDNGLKISLGIERSVFVNNELVATTFLNIPDLAALSARGAAPGQLQGSPVTLVQNGPGNALGQSVLQSFGSGLLTIVQNSLDNQLIQGRTIINTNISGVGSLGLSNTISALNVQSRAAAR